MLKPLLFASAVVLFGISASFASGPAPQETTPAAASGEKNPVKPTPQSQARAKEVYVVDCALCHGATGDGKTDVAKDMDLTLGDWTDSKTLASKTDKELFEIIRNGKGKMPAEPEGRARDHEVWNLILYIRAMAKGQSPAAQQPPAAPTPTN